MSLVNITTLAALDLFIQNAHNVLALVLLDFGTNPTLVGQVNTIVAQNILTRKIVAARVNGGSCPEIVNALGQSTTMVFLFKQGVNVAQTSLASDLPTLVKHFI